MSEPAPMLPGPRTRLGALLDHVGARAGYGWEWKDGGVVFYRYRDAAWAAARRGSGAAPPAPEIDAPEPSGDPLSGLFAWFGRLFGGEEREEKAETPAAHAEAGEAESAATETAAATAREEAKPARPGEPAPLAGQAVAARAGDGREEAAKPGEAGQGEGADPEAPRVWEVVPEDQKTLRGVLEAWAERAEWTVAWRAERNFSVGAPATFEGGFLEAVDSLLSDPGISRVLTARAHANRYLVIEGTRR